MPGLEESSSRRGHSSSRESSMSLKRKRSPSLKRGSPMPQNHDVHYEKSKFLYQAHSSENFHNELLDNKIATQRRRLQRSPLWHDKRRHSSSKEDVHYYGQSNCRQCRRRESPSPSPSSSHSFSYYSSFKISFPLKRSFRRGHQRLHAAWKWTQKL